MAAAAAASGAAAVVEGCGSMTVQHTAEVVFDVFKHQEDAAGDVAPAKQ